MTREEVDGSYVEVEVKMEVSWRGIMKAQGHTP